MLPFIKLVLPFLFLYLTYRHVKCQSLEIKLKVRLPLQGESSQGQVGGFKKYSTLTSKDMVLLKNDVEAEGNLIIFLITSQGNARGFIDHKAPPALVNIRFCFWAVNYICPPFTEVEH